MIFKRPKMEPQDGLEEVLAPDTVDVLIEFTSSTNWVGKMIGDLYIAYTKGRFMEWTSLEEADNLMPYFHGSKTQKQIGYRFWWLSRHNTPINIRRRVYHGCWLDKKVKKSGGREHIKFIRLSAEAVKCFETRAEIFEGLYL